MKSHAAFISYSHRYRDWVAALGRDLERCLTLAGETREVFLDQTALTSGRSWVQQLQDGLDEAEHLVLVVTPEAMASPRVADEWNGFIARRQDWRDGHLHIVLLLDAPLPSFLSSIHYVDFRRPDAYRDALRQLAGGLLGRAAQDLPELPGDVGGPEPPRALPAELRRRLLGWLEPVMPKKIARRIVAVALGLEYKELDGHSDAEGAASAALALATGDDDPLEAALRVVGILADELDEDETPARLAELDAIRSALAARRGTGETGLVGTWLRTVVRDHERLVAYFQQHAELELLDRVYVQLELRHRERLLDVEGRLGEKTRLDRPWTIRELLDLDPEEHPWVTRRWVVVGDPGAGKTTLLRHLAASAARSTSDVRIPVFESLPRLMREPQWILDRFERQMRRAGEAADGLAAALDRTASASSCRPGLPPGVESPRYHLSPFGLGAYGSFVARG